MKVILLAAGRSKRMQPVRDKNFLEFLGKPLIVHQLEALKSSGFQEAIIVGGAHNLDELAEKTAGVEMSLSFKEQEDLEAGMCGAILSLKGVVGDEPILVVSSNDVVDEKAFELIRERFEPGEADSYILAKKVESYFPGGYLQVGDDGFIEKIVEKPGEGNEPSDMINLVVHLHTQPQKLIEYLEKVSSQKDDLYEVALSEMIADGMKFEAIPYDGFWQAVKFPWHVQGLFEYLMEKAVPVVDESAEIAESAVLNGKVIVGRGVKIFDNSVISGPAYIGDNSLVANNALVRGSNVGRDCVVGFGTEVARSFLGNEVWTHSNYIGDSVIGSNVSFGAGCVTGNLRLDEGEVEAGAAKFGLVTGDNIRAGINTSFMPGVRIGSGSFIGAGITVAEDIPEKSFVRGKWELKISENKIDVSKMKRKK